MFQTTIQYRSMGDIDIYDSASLDRLATQMARGRYLRMLSEEKVVRIQLLEDDYEGFIKTEDLVRLQFAGLICYRPLVLSESQIQERINDAIAYALKAMAQPNEYLWGGTVPPNFDCSGLIQAAFASVEIWLPRDAYQQEAFVTPVALSEVKVGDLIFFGNAEKATHVGLYLGEGSYIHSSGKQHGHNGIALSLLSGEDPVSQYYASHLRGAGRVTRCYQGRSVSLLGD